MMDRKIWTDHPAATGIDPASEAVGNWLKEVASEGWNSATPIGNGSLGAMVYGDPIHDILQLNEETVWGGDDKLERVNPKAKDSWRKVRELLSEGRIKEAEKLTKSDLFSTRGDPRWYDTAGNVRFEYKHTDYSAYKRMLELDSAVCYVNYRADGHRFEREYLASAPDRVIAVHHNCPDGRYINMSADFSKRDGNTDYTELCENGILIYASEPENGCRYCILAATDSDGCVIYNEKGFDVYDASYLTVYITVRSTYHADDITEWCNGVIENVLESNYQSVKHRHIQDYRYWFTRCYLEIDGENRSHIPTDERIIKSGEEQDNSLIGLYFDFARYLLISSSRPGTLPANLQGIWNKDRYPAWGSKYTININAEMNYWPAEVMGLSELHMPLIGHLKTMLPRGRKMAKEMYGLDGFVAHHNTDIFGDCAPTDYWMPATIWPMGAAWICTHVKTHYDYTGDKEFLKEYLPILKECCLFFTQYLFEHNGKLITGPSVSPENTYIHTSGESGCMCNGPAMDSQILRDLFGDTVYIAKLLGEEDELTDKVAEMLEKLPEPSIGKHGNIMEWIEDYDETEVGHRHISHLYGLYPSAQFTYEKTPELMTAARATLERRLAHGGGHTGWSRAWIINMWARLRDGEKAGENVNALLCRSTYPNMFDKHPPFQIDGNFGGAAGIAEMLLQSQNGIIVLLPALPEAWPSGRFTGFKARGGVSVDLEWSGGKVLKAVLHNEQSRAFSVQVPEGCVLKYGNKIIEGAGTVTFAEGESGDIVIERA